MEKPVSLCGKNGGKSSREAGEWEEIQIQAIMAVAIALKSKVSSKLVRGSPSIPTRRQKLEKSKKIRTLTQDRNSAREWCPGENFTMAKDNAILSETRFFLGRAEVVRDSNTKRKVE